MSSRMSAMPDGIPMDFTNRSLRLDDAIVESPDFSFDKAKQECHNFLKYYQKVILNSDKTCSINMMFQLIKGKELYVVPSNILSDHNFDNCLLSDHFSRIVVMVKALVIALRADAVIQCTECWLATKCSCGTDTVNFVNGICPNCQQEMSGKVSENPHKKDAIAVILETLTGKSMFLTSFLNRDDNNKVISFTEGSESIKESDSIKQHNGRFSQWWDVRAKEVPHVLMCCHNFCKYLNIEPPSAVKRGVEFLKTAPPEIQSQILNINIMTGQDASDLLKNIEQNDTVNPEDN